MAKITKILMGVSEAGNPIARVWLDDADILKTSEAIILGIKSQVDYVSTKSIGDEIDIKVSKGWKNVVVPKADEVVIDNPQIIPDQAPKYIAMMLKNVLSNYQSSLEYLKLGEVNNVCLEELKSGIASFLDEKMLLEEIVYTHIMSSKSVPKLHKNMVKVLEKEDAKQSEIKDAQEIISRYTAQLNREYIQKNNLRLEKES